jgi:hypothetical protein
MTGPMFSGKTGELFRRIRRYNIAKKVLECFVLPSSRVSGPHRHCLWLLLTFVQATLIIKYSADTRYSTEAAATHDRFCMDAVPTSRLSELESMAVHYDIIGIDEGQFFPDVVEFSESVRPLPSRFKLLRVIILARARINRRSPCPIVLIQNICHPLPVPSDGQRGQGGDCRLPRRHVSTQTIRSGVGARAHGREHHQAHRRVCGLPSRGAIFVPVRSIPPTH